MSWWWQPSSWATRTRRFGRSQSRPQRPSSSTTASCTVSGGLSGQLRDSREISDPRLRAWPLSAPHAVARCGQETEGQRDTTLRDAEPRGRARAGWTRCPCRASDAPYAYVCIALHMSGCVTFANMRAFVRACVHACIHVYACACADPQLIEYLATAKKGTPPPEPLVTCFIYQFACNICVSHTCATVL